MNKIQYEVEIRCQMSVFCELRSAMQILDTPEFFLLDKSKNSWNLNSGKSFLSKKRKLYLFHLPTLILVFHYVYTNLLYWICSKCNLF